MVAYTEYQHDARVRREAEALAHTGRYQVSILVLKTGERPLTSEIAGVRVVEVNQAKYSGGNKLFYISSYFQFFSRCLSVCTWLFLKGRVDFIHVHNMPDFLVFAAILPRAFNCRLILDIHDSMPETYLSKFSRQNSVPFKLLCLEEQASAAIAHRVVCVNHVQKDVLVRRGIRSEKVTITMNIPDPALFPVNGNPGVAVRKNGVFRMVYHGTIAKRLGVDLAVRAVAQLSPVIPGIEFHLWSAAGAAMDSIESLATELNVASRVHLLRGGIPLERLANELKIMNLGIVSNRKEVATELMLPVKMLEYIALGIPVVAPKLKCIRYYFSEAMVTYFEPENVESMASAILALYQDPERRLEQARLAKAFLDHYNWDKHKYELISMYDNL